MTSLSVVILVWNRGDLLEQCLEHIYKADMPEGTELILLDNGSTDPKVLEILDKAESAEAQAESVYPIKVRRYPTNLMNEAYNLASDLYEGDNILLVNTDCFLREGTVTEMLMAKGLFPTEGRPDRVGVVGAQLLYGDGRVQHGGVRLDPTTRLPSHVNRYAPGEMRTEGPFTGLVQAVPGVTGALILYDRQCWDELGGLGHEFPLYFTDIDFCLRAWEKGWATVYAEDAIATHLEAASHVPTAGLPKGYEEQQARYLAKWGPGAALPAPVQRMVYG